MRLWSLHPKYLDPSGLTAVWREALLAQKVLAGGTKGYTRHPQLERFRAQRDPIAAIGMYLEGILAESIQRGYHFDAGKIRIRGGSTRIPVTRGQLRYEAAHLRRKVRARNPVAYRNLRQVDLPDPHPMFRVVEGETEEWERRKLSNP